MKPLGKEATEASYESETSQLGFEAIKIPRFLDTSRNDLVKQFFEPLLIRSIAYDRGVGYFSSGWLRVNAIGLAAFAANGGRARWITSPILDEFDFQALARGHEAKDDPLLKDRLRRTVADLPKVLSEETLEALAWMVADGILEFRIAIPRNKLTGDFHDKFGIFADRAGELVVFNGSYNDSVQGLRNYESLKVFHSKRESDVEITSAEVERFERLWWNQDENVHVLTLPETVQQDLVQLRKRERPYKLLSPPPPAGRVNHPGVPTNLKLREYQKAAVKAWFEADGRGILKMATGTGKTVVALTAGTKLEESLRKARKSLCVIVVCPYQHLVDQWERESKEFGFRPILCYESRASWLADANAVITELKANPGGNGCLIATNSTFCGSTFQNLLRSVEIPILLIADEVHNLGAEEALQALPESADYRLGLSATPDRWMDEEGTKAIFAYFGETVFEFDLKDAIQAGALTPYNYHPILVELEPDELENYVDLTQRIAELSARKKREVRDEEALKFALLKRARLIASARNKLAALREVLSSSELQNSTHNLIYCGDGRVGAETDETEKRQVEAIGHLVGRQLGWKSSTYTAETPRDLRVRLLDDFAKGKLQALVAIRCLDEGVDVRETRRAFILASSTNPRQFIQRRGRVLRRAEGKDVSDIWDFLVIPPSGSIESAVFNVERQLVSRELQRVLEFATLARNGPQASRLLLKVKKDYNLLHL